MNLYEICGSIAEELAQIEENEVSDRFLEEVSLFAGLWQALPEEQKKEEMQKLVDIIRKEKYLSAIYLYSFATYHIHDKKWMEELLEMILGITHLSVDTLYFLWWQISERFMLWPECETEHGKVLHWKLLHRICEIYAEDVKGSEWIEERERNGDLVVVITAQFLSGKVHGPTKTALDRCKALTEVLHKKVLLINTAEVLPTVGEVPYIGQVIPAYGEDLCNLESIEWRGLKIPFFQCDNNMPNIDVLKLLVNNIVQMKPQFVVEIGTGSILANLVSKCLPVLSVVTGFSRLSVTDTQYQVSALKVTDKERRILEHIGKDESHVISALFTFGLKEQQEKWTREELGLPQDKFLLVVVGTRLDLEIDDEFMRMLQSVDNRQIGVAYIGNFAKYERFSQDYPELRDAMYYLGVQKDVVAILELCDLFVNPIRLGGGTSAAEALSKGLPVVSTPYGDVGAIVGEDFWVEDYFDMAKMINRYQQDEAFYRMQSELAKKRAELLLDTDGEFVKVIKEFGDRMGENYI